MIGNLIGIGIAVGIWIALLAVWPRYKQPSAKKETITDWPAFIDDVASGVRAGLSLPYATFDAGTRLPTRQDSHFRQTLVLLMVCVWFMDCLY
jgi:hypothetical protein